METTRIFKSGNSQAVRLPKEMRLAGDRVYIKKVGRAVVLLPFEEPWQVLWDSLALFSADFMAERTQPAQVEREPLFE